MQIRVSGVFSAQCVATSVARGELEAFGDLARMRWSEVKLPDA